MTKRRINFPQLKKEDIIVYGVTIPDGGQYYSSAAFRQIREMYASHQYPFGMRKLQMHGPEEVKGVAFRVYATVRMTAEQYARKCAYCDVEGLRSICGEWLKKDHPEMVDWFLMKCLEARNIKISKMEKKNVHV